jgi:hypothetical protein
VRRMLTTSISQESDQASSRSRESGVPVSNVTAGCPPRGRSARRRGPARG